MATTATSAQLRLAVNGGAPVRDEHDHPLPQRAPRVIAPEAYDNVKQVLDSGFTLDLVSEFEREFADACGVRYGVALANCTSAIHAVIGALALGPGDEVIVSPITDYGSLAGVVHQGAAPVLPDVDPGTGLMTAEHVERVITSRTRAIIAVHFYGQICDMDPIIDLAQRHNIPVIEDVCQATFAEYKGRRAGSIGDVGCFSFDGGKLLPTDNGGMAVTDNRDLAEAIRFFAVDRGSVQGASARLGPPESSSWPTTTHFRRTRSSWWRRSCRTLWRWRSSCPRTGWWPTAVEHLRSASGQMVWKRERLVKPCERMCPSDGQVVAFLTWQ